MKAWKLFCLMLAAVWTATFLWPYVMFIIVAVMVGVKWIEDKVVALLFTVALIVAS